jgi:hypothetical protein
MVNPLVVCLKVRSLEKNKECGKMNKAFKTLKKLFNSKSPQIPKTKRFNSKFPKGHPTICDQKPPQKAKTSIISHHNPPKSKVKVYISADFLLISDIIKTCSIKMV